jgi:hypothetical protein
VNPNLHTRGGATVFPATCSVGEAFFKSDAPAGMNCMRDSRRLQAGAPGATDATGPKASRRDRNERSQWSNRAYSE